ncbi:DUF6541 family protein [Brachybacterium huguangmaarense]
MIAVIAAAAILYLPGIALLTALRCRVPFRIGLAPAATAALFGVSGFAFAPLGIRWDPVPVAIAIVVGVSLAALLGFALSRGGIARDRPDSQPKSPVAVIISILGALAAAAVVLVPVLSSSVGLGSIASSFDAVFHYNAVAYVRADGRATPWTALSGMYAGQDTFYPVSLHLLAAFVPGSPVEAMNAMLLVILASSGFTMTSLLWSVAPRSLPTTLTAIVIASTVPAVSLFFSVPVMVLVMGLWPNALAAVVFPAVLAAALHSIRVIDSLRRHRTWRSRAVHLLDLTPEVIVIIGGVLIHPVILFQLGVVVFALGVVHAALVARVQRRRAIAQAALLVAVLVAFDVAGATVLRGMALTAKVETGLPTTVITLMADRPRITAIPLKASYVVVVYVLALVGAVYAIRSRSRLRCALVSLLCVSFVIALGTAYSWTPLSSLANPWYQARERVMPVVTTAVIPLAMLGGCWSIGLVRRRWPRHTALAVALLVGSAAVPAVGTATDPQRLPSVVELMSDSGAREGYYVAYVGKGEADFIARSAAELPHDALVLGDPAEGASMYWAIGDRAVLYPHLGRPSTSQQRTIAANADKLDQDPSVCALLQRQGDDLYLYRDYAQARAAVPGDVDYYAGLRDLPLDDLRVVSRSPDGRQVLYRIEPGC